MYMEKTMQSSTNLSNARSSSEGDGGNSLEDDTSETFMKTSIRDRIFHAARDGFPLAISILLKTVDEKLANKLVNESYLDEDGQTCTPLVIAARYGRYRVVETLLKNFNVDLETECAVCFDGHIVEGVCALWAACGSGHLNIIKLLVQHGAEVDHKTVSNSTPLRAACFEGRLDVVEYLVTHGADVNTVNIFNNTCLMLAAYKGHTTVVEYLLKNGADVDVQAKCGATALHYAAEMGYRDVCQLLLENGAALKLNEYGMTPVIAAAEKTREYVVDLFYSWPHLLNKADQIDALELMGASFANDKDNYNPNKAFHYLWEAMQLRYEDLQNVIRKKTIPPIRAYQNWIESQTPQDLQAIQFNHNSIHMEALTIRERILGRKCPELAHPIIFRGAVCADNNRFDQCEALWMHALELRQEINISVQRDLLRFVQVFSQMIQVNEPLRFDVVVTVLEKCIIEIEKNYERLKNPTRKDDIPVIKEDTELNVTTILYLITIITKCLKMSYLNIQADQLTTTYKLLLKVNKMELRLRDGQTLLHLAANGTTPVDEFHTHTVCRFPCVDTVKLLLYCGAKVNVFDLGRNTPLHTLVSTLQTAQHPEAELFTIVEEMVKLFHQNGMHFDAVNCDGLKPAIISGSGIIENQIKKIELEETTLKCLASRSIAQHHIPYKGMVPLNMESFIQLHSADKL